MNSREPTVDGQLCEFQTWSKDWWAYLLHKIENDESVRFMLHYAHQGDVPVKRLCVVKADAMPSLDQLAMLNAYLSDGDEMAAWRPWLQEHGLPLRPWTHKFSIFLPSPTPPRGKQSIWKRHSTASEPSNGRDARPLDGAGAGRQT